MTFTRGSLGIDISGKVKILQIVQKIFIKDLKTSQIIHIFFCEMQILDVINHLIQACCNGESVSTGIIPVECIKNNGLLHRIFEISLHHGQLIQIS